MSYIPNTDVDRARMLEAIGLTSIEELFADIPEEVRFPPLDLPAPLSEMEVARLLGELAERNADLDHHACFLGAGAYRHFVPAVVDHILGRGEFYTCYTPYQPEVSQGTLTAIFEYQTLVCQLTGMEVANASMYDGASALAEAALMACRVTRREGIVASEAIHPEYRQVLRTYTQGIGLEIRSAGYVKDAPWGRTDLAQLRDLTDEETACVIVQYPNFFGVIEDLAAVGEIAHERGALFVVCADPIALGLLRPPGDCGADIVVGEGQALGSPPSFGGPYLGLFATRMKYVRQMPGRVVGRTRDTQGRRGFVLTLQTREQHIRREKATSNICTNEALMALAATVYLAAMGKGGLRRAAELCYHKAHHAAARIAELPGFEVLSEPFFKEFVVRMPRPPAEVNAQLLERRIIGGYDLGRAYPELANSMLLCVTEMNTREEIDALVTALGEISEKAP